MPHINMDKLFLLQSMCNISNVQQHQPRKKMIKKIPLFFDKWKKKKKK